MIDTTTDKQISNEMFSSYLKSLVNRFFKILPIREEEGENPVPYIQSLQSELLGFGSLIKFLNNDSGFLVLVSVLQFLQDNPKCPLADVRREVFKCITICDKLKARYVGE